jgi:5-methylcytosine-specific restriction endonuclease McrA
MAMKRNPDWARVWAQVEDGLVPALRLAPCERALYYHLLRLTRVRGCRRVCISKRELARRSVLSLQTVIRRMNSLARRGCIRIVERNHRGSVLEVLTPEEISRGGARRDPRSYVCSSVLRAAIYRRERGRCFYCLRRLTPGLRTLDHVVPLADGGDHSCRNVVACCFPCNTRKHSLPAPEFLRVLLREGRLTPLQFRERRAALRALPRLRPAAPPPPKRRRPGQRIGGEERGPHRVSAAELRIAKSVERL